MAVSFEEIRQTIYHVTPKPRILEMGAKQSIPGRSTLRKNEFPEYSEYLGTDFEPGADVDIIADAHELSKVCGEETFDVILCYSVLEHVQDPYVVAHEMIKTLKVGGYIHVQTHQSFPLHAYPADYWRFTTEALRLLYPARFGMKLIDVYYEFMAWLVSKRDPFTQYGPSFLNVCYFGHKLTHTQKQFTRLGEESK
jgi:SAM-dependent methyltransferase